MDQENSTGSQAAEKVTPASEIAGRVNGDISDLFFNTDVSCAAIHDEKGHFVRWDDGRLAIEAEIFLNCLYRLGVAVPSQQALIADFLARI